jgi:hypothetical protein
VLGVFRVFLSTAGIALYWIDARREVEKNERNTGARCIG